MSILDENGSEVFDQTPVQTNMKFERPQPLHLRIRDQILRTMQAMQDETDIDTPEEADDFSMEEEDVFCRPTQYTMEDDFDHLNYKKSTVNNAPLSEQEKSKPADASAAGKPAPAGAADAATA